MKLADRLQVWESYYASLDAAYLFPNEFVVRTFLGRYPGLSLPHDYEGAKVVDVGCGDGRNLTLLHALGMQLHATEISETICARTREKLAARAQPIHVDIRPGLNWDLPFADATFDYALGWNSLYYMRDEKADFSQHVAEIGRVIRPGGHLVACVPTPTCFSLEEAEELGGELIRIRTRSKWKMLNGTIYRRFRSTADIERAFGSRFEDFSWARLSDDCFGLRLEYFVFTCRRR